MGRHTKGVATFLATLHDLTARRRQFEDGRLDCPIASGASCTGWMQSDGRRRLTRGGTMSPAAPATCET